MKLVTYNLVNDASGSQRLGAMLPDESAVVDLQRASEQLRGTSNSWFLDMTAFLKGRADSREEARYLVKNSSDDCIVKFFEIKLLAPIPRPVTLRDTMCYEDHYVNCLKAVALLQGNDPSTMPAEAFKPPKVWYEMPLFYKSNVNSIVATDENVAFPEGEQFKDYELELAVFICKEGKDINARDAMDYVGGFTIFNDFSARFLQIREMNKEFHVGPGICKDFANAMGPCLVTPDAFDHTNATAVVRVNGEERGRSNTGLLYHSLQDVIQHISNNTTLYPGDVIGLGTVPLGAGVEVLKPLLIGDVIELEIEGIGVLRNTIIAPKVVKVRNRSNIYKRYVCGKVDGRSQFVIDDYPDVTKSQYVDIWKLNETPASISATLTIDQGNAPFEQEPPRNGSVLRFIALNPELRQFPNLQDLPPAKRKFFVDVACDLHKTIGTHYLPTEEDMQKSLTMHKTDSLNLFICVDGKAISINDEDEIHLEPGDAFVQLGTMHGWSYTGEPPVFIGGLLVDADPTCITQLTEAPAKRSESKANRFKRYVSGTMHCSDKAIGKSKVIFDDYAPNEAELFDTNGKHVGWAGDIWRTFSAKADLSGREDTVVEKLCDRPSKDGITFRMVELLPNCSLSTNPDIVSYYTVVSGELSAQSETDSVCARKTEHIVQLKTVMTLKNNTSDSVRFAHFMIDAQ